MSIIKFRLKRWVALIFICLFCVVCVSAATPTKTNDEIKLDGKATLKMETKGIWSGTDKVVDFSFDQKAGEFKKQDDITWLGPDHKLPLEFDELIYSWHNPIDEGEGWRLHLRVGFDDGSHSPWLYAGFWGKVNQVESRENPTFEHGHIAMDQLLLTKTARSVQFKLENTAEVPIKNIPDLHIIATNNNPSSELLKKAVSITTMDYPPFLILDLPLRAQADSQGNPLPDRCQSAAVASAMQYFGRPIPVEDILPWTYDPEYEYPGIWPRTLGAAEQFGFDTYIDRFRTWDAVRRTVSQNKVILCSIKMPKDGDYKAPPYPSMGGHIVALNGITEDGRVIVTDSALAKSGKGYRCQWLQEDFEKIWMQNKGGVGMVICPPDGAELKVVDDLTPFPDDRIK